MQIACKPVSNTILRGSVVLVVLQLACSIAVVLVGSADRLCLHASMWCRALFASKTVNRHSVHPPAIGDKPSENIEHLVSLLRRDLALSLHLPQLALESLDPRILIALTRADPRQYADDVLNLLLLQDKVSSELAQSSLKGLRTVRCWLGATVVDESSGICLARKLGLSLTRIRSAVCVCPVR